MSSAELQMIQDLSNAMQTLITSLNKRLEALEQNNQALEDRIAKLEEGKE